MTILEANGVSKNFGGLKALSGVSFAVEAGEILGVIGPNGSGKTTLFNVLTGIYPPSAGTVIYRGEQLSGLPPYHVTRRGVVRTFQNIRIFSNMTVMDNVLVGRHSRMGTSLLDAVLKTRSKRLAESSAHEKAGAYLDFAGLGAKKGEIAANLSYGEQRRLEIARALASEPSLLLLDEPGAGMNPYDAGRLMSLIKEIRTTGITILLIEHNMRVLMGISDRVIALEAGRKIAEGTPEEIQRNPDVIRAYLGSQERTEEKAC